VSAAAEPTGRRVIPDRALDTTAEHPWPVRLLSTKMAQYIAKMPFVWIEGQVVQLVRRPGQTVAYLTLRDTDVDFSLQVTANVRVLDVLGADLVDGARVVVHVKPTFWEKRGTLQLTADQIRPVGVGELLAQIEHLKRLLASEGLLSASRKRALPFLPLSVGLVCGRASAAERDVVENARRRWPAVRFAIREVAVQGPHAVTQVIDALRELDADRDVEVIVIARGGGSLEDLLPFSNETLLRAVAAARTPVVSAIGHDVDTPLLDLVADVRASTPTDAASCIVPDVEDELAALARSRERLDQAIVQRLEREQAALRALRSRPVLADPHTVVDVRAREVDLAVHRARQSLATRLDRAADQVQHLRAQVRALSPAATLDRGYAVVQRADRIVVRSPDDVATGERLRVRVAGGEFTADAR
jgi:exodeoxyribonuclease VII large subunit